MKTLARITPEGFVFKVPGGETVTPHPEGTFPADAFNPSFDPETLTLTYHTPPSKEGGDPVEHQRTFTSAEIESAKTPPPAPLPVPESLSRKDFRLAAASVGITKDVILTQLNGIEDEQVKDLAIIEYEESLRFTRQWPLLEALAGQLGLSSEQIDDLFRLGKSFKGKSPLDK